MLLMRRIKKIHERAVGYDFIITSLELLTEVLGRIANFQNYKKPETDCVNVSFSGESVPSYVVYI